MQAYARLRPGEVFGYNFIGFLHYRLGDYRASIEALERAIELEPDNVYALSLLARDYALLYGKTESGTQRRHYREQSLAMQQRAAAARTPDTLRVTRLQAWLDRRLR
jgi:lipoprotein NlpI